MRTNEINRNKEKGRNGGHINYNLKEDQIEK